MISIMSEKLPCSPAAAYPRASARIRSASSGLPFAIATSAIPDRQRIIPQRSPMAWNSVWPWSRWTAASATWPLFIIRCPLSACRPARTHGSGWSPSACSFRWVPSRSPEKNASIGWASTSIGWRVSWPTKGDTLRSVSISKPGGGSSTPAAVAIAARMWHSAYPSARPGDTGSVAMSRTSRAHSPASVS